MDGVSLREAYHASLRREDQALRNMMRAQADAECRKARAEKAEANYDELNADYQRTIKALASALDEVAQLRERNAQLNTDIVHLRNAVRDVRRATLREVREACEVLFCSVPGQKRITMALQMTLRDWENLEAAKEA